MATIMDKIGEPAVLEQLSEECAELAHAALKMSRALRGENPTPLTKDACLVRMLEEMADVYVVLDEWLRNKPPGYICQINEVMEAKEKRWYERCEL